MVHNTHRYDQYFLVSRHIFAYYRQVESVHTDYTAKKDRKTNKRHAARQKGKSTGTHLNMETDRQTDKQTDGQMRKLKSGLTHILFLIHIHGDGFILT